MAIPGYDPEDVEETVRERLDGGDPGELLDEEERRAYESGEDLLEALDSETLESLVVGEAVQTERESVAGAGAQTLEL